MTEHIPSIDGASLRAFYIKKGLVRPSSNDRVDVRGFFPNMPILKMDERAREEAARVVALARRGQWGDRR